MRLKQATAAKRFGTACMKEANGAPSRASTARDVNARFVRRVVLLLSRARMLNTRKVAAGARIVVASAMSRL